MLILCYILMFALLALSAFYNGAETALTSANRVWLKERAASGDARAAIASRFQENSERFLGTVLIGHNICAVSLATVGRISIGMALVQCAALQRLLPAVADPGSSWAEWLTSIILTPVALIFAEVLPKAAGRARANRLALACARPMRLSERLLAPLVWMMAGLSRLLTPAAQDDARARITRDDLKSLAEMAAEQGLVGEDAGEMLQTVLDLDQQPVETAMVPLIEIQSVPDTATVRDVLELTARTGFTYLPVFHERVDRIIGVVSLKDISARHAPADDEEAFLAAPIRPYIARDLLYVPESQSVNTLLGELRQRRIPIAAVVDEYGGIIGMVAVEDLVELITGSLNDERDEEISSIRRLSPDAFLCSGRMEIRTLEEHLGMDIQNQGFETAAGLVLKLAGHIPAAGEHVHFRQVTITVLEVVNHRITRLKFQRSQTPGE